MYFHQRNYLCKINFSVRATINGILVTIFSCSRSGLCLNVIILSNFYDFNDLFICSEYKCEKKTTKKNKYVKNCKNILTRITNMQLENMIGKVDYKELMYF